MKKKILFMLINMNIGGTEKALLNMIAEIPKEKYDITLLMLEEYGGFLSYIPDGVQVEYVTGYKSIKGILNKPPHITALEFLKKGEVFKSFNILAFHLLSKLTRDKGIFFKYVLKKSPVLRTEYDIAVAYAGPMDFISYFVVNKIKAKKKIQWIHFDLEKISFNKNYASKLYPKFDKVFAVSKEAKNQLDKMLPKLKEKTEVFYNLISSRLMSSEAKNGIGFKDNFHGIRILTVGRLTSQKGQDLIPRILIRLISKGYNIRWYCIGEGKGRFELERLIKKYKLEGQLILLGNIINPYPYFEQCDLYVQPSRYEGYCITLAEARVFNKPIVITDFVGSEQITDGKTGIIVEFDEEQLYKAIRKLVNDENLRSLLINNLEKETVETTNDLEKLYKVFQN